MGQSLNGTKLIKLSAAAILAMTEPFTFVPGHMRNGIARYIEHGVRGGDFQRALFSNDLKQSLDLADNINGQHIKSMVAWIYNYAPMGCHGSHEIVEGWSKSFKQEKENENRRI